MSTEPSIKTSTIVIASVATIVTGVLGRPFRIPSVLSTAPSHMQGFSSCPLPWLTIRIAYAVYFDHRRQTDPQFRKTLKKESRKIAKAAKEEQEAQGAQQKEAIKKAVDEAMEEGFPTDTEDKEAYFMNEVGRGEALCQDGERPPCLYHDDDRILSYAQDPLLKSKRPYVSTRL